MAITSLKPIKAKNKREVIGKRSPSFSSRIGFTDSESRGIFGKYHEYTADEKKRIAEYKAKKAESEKARLKPDSGEHPVFEFQQRSKAEQNELRAKVDGLRKMGVKVVGYADGNGAVTSL
jgi:hypothetical protein